MTGLLITTEAASNNNNINIIALDNNWKSAIIVT